MQIGSNGQNYNYPNQGNQPPMQQGFNPQPQMGQSFNQQPPMQQNFNQQNSQFNAGYNQAARGIDFTSLVKLTIFSFIDLFGTPGIFNHISQFNFKNISNIFNTRTTTLSTDKFTPVLISCLSLEFIVIVLGRIVDILTTIGTVVIHSYMSVWNIISAVISAIFAVLFSCAITCLFVHFVNKYRDKWSATAIKVVAVLMILGTVGSAIAVVTNLIQILIPGALIDNIWSFISNLISLATDLCVIGAMSYIYVDSNDMPMPANNFNNLYQQNNTYNQPINNGYNQPQQGYNQPINNGYNQPQQYNGYENQNYQNSYNNNQTFGTQNSADDMSFNFEVDNDKNDYFDY